MHVLRAFVLATVAVVAIACASTPVIDSPRDAIGLAYVLVIDVAEARDGALRSGLITSAEADRVTADLQSAMAGLGAARQALNAGNVVSAGEQTQAATAALQAVRSVLIARGASVGAQP